MTENDDGLNDYVGSLQDDLLKANKRNKQLLTALRSAKRVIRELHRAKEPAFHSDYWNEFNKAPRMQRINKALKDGKV